MYFDVIHFVVFCSIATVTFAQLPPKINNRPIIGIATQETDKSQAKYGKTYIVANYVKYLELAGARVVPVFVNQTADYYTNLFNSINGILFPGGSLDEELLKSGYGKLGRVVFDYAKKINDARDHFPIWGTCEGFQLLVCLAAGKDVLAVLPAEHVSLPLDFVVGYRDSRLFHDAPEAITKVLSSANVTFNVHQFSLTLDNYTSNPGIQDMFRIISTNNNPEGKMFLSTLEAFRYPFYATQWHPEKNIFEWDLKSESSLNHSQDGVMVSQYMTNFFVNEARKSLHKFKTPEEEAKALIYQYPVTYTGDIVPWEQTYYFDL